ncbi:hypothetical protein [Nostoc sp.]|uniref:hypothetical protein n=1 Tax=Nostoc sp. TaxID=1180 RepID=UPI002FFA7B08
MNTETSSKTKATVWMVKKGQVRPRLDQLSTEEPLFALLPRFIHSPCNLIAKFYPNFWLKITINLTSNT